MTEPQGRKRPRAPEPFPYDPADVTREFVVPMPTGRGVYKAVKGIELGKGNKRYVCIDCPGRMWIAPTLVGMHRGEAHRTAASDARIRRREAQRLREAQAKVGVHTPKAEAPPAEATEPAGQLALVVPADSDIQPAVRKPKRAPKPSKAELEPEQMLDFGAPSMAVSVNEFLDTLIQSRAWWQENARVAIERADRLTRIVDQMAQHMQAMHKLIQEYGNVQA